MATPALFTDEWIASCNEAFAARPELGGEHRLVVTERVTGAPETSHGAVSLVADDDGVRLVVGEEPGATAWLTVAMRDATALHEGILDPARALAEGKLRVRGDLRAVVEAVGLLADAHAALQSRDD